MRHRHFFTTLLVALLGLVFADVASAMYHPDLGRHMQRDPNGMQMGPAASLGGGFIERDFNPYEQYADGLNLYQYVGSSPINYLDPSGLFKVKGPARIHFAAEKLVADLDRRVDGTPYATLAQAGQQTYERTFGIHPPAELFDRTGAFWFTNDDRTVGVTGTVMFIDWDLCMKGGASPVVEANEVIDVYRDGEWVHTDHRFGPTDVVELARISNTTSPYDHRLIYADGPGVNYSMRQRGTTRVAVLQSTELLRNGSLVAEVLWQMEIVVGRRGRTERVHLDIFRNEVHDD